MKGINKAVLRQVVLAAVVVDFPLLYAGAVGIESAAMTAAALAVMAAAALVAAIVY